MSSPASSLTDVTAPPNPPAARPAEPAAQPAPPAAAVVTDPEAAEIGRIIHQSGWNKDQVNDLLQAPGALQTLRYMIANDPKQFIATLERADPSLGSNFLEKMTDLYLDRYGDRSEGGVGTGNNKSNPNSELDSTVRELRERIDQMTNEREQDRQRAHLASVESRYKARVDDLFGQLPKDLNLTKAQIKALRAQLGEEISSDPSARDRVITGNFVDVPAKFQTIIQDWTNDQKATQEALKAERDKQKSAAMPAFLTGPAAALAPKPEMADSWEATEEGLVSAINKLAGA